MGGRILSPGKDGQPSRPDFTSQFARMNVIDKDCEWYNMRFAAGFLGLSLDDKMHKLNAANRLRLEYYLGNQIALDPAYTRQTQAVATLAAVTASPVLQQYVADAQTNGTDWGQQLSDYLNAPEQLASIAQQVLSNAEGGMAQIDDYATLLTVFDETGALGTAYYNNVVTSLSAMLALTGDISQDSSLPAWMPDYIDAFVEAYRNGGNRPIEAGPDQTAFDIAEELYEASQTLGNSANLAKLIYTNLQKNPGISLGEQAEEVAAASSTQVTLSKSLYSVFLAAGLVMSIYALANWDELEQDEQAAAMTNLAGVIYSVGANAPDILTGAAWVTSKLNTEIELALEARNTIELVEVFQLRAGLPRPTLFTRFLTWLKPLGQSGQNAFNTAGTRIGTFFKAYPRILNGLGAVISAAALGISIWSLVADVQSGAGAAIIVFDSIQVVLGAVMVVCAVLSVIPVLDFVTGVIGAATAIISALLAAAQFLWNWFNPPSDPVGDFFNALVNPLVAILPDPPAGWAPAQPAEGI
jgi:hypothetical protein